MLYFVTFNAVQGSDDDEPKSVKKVALVQGESTTEVTANLLKVIESHPEINLSSPVVSSISPSHISEVHFDKSSEDVFYKVRVGFKDSTRNNYKFTYWVVQASNLLSAVQKANQLSSKDETQSILYSCTNINTLVNEDLCGDFAFEE